MHDRRIVGDELHKAQNVAQRLARLMAGDDRVGDGDRAGIDEGIARDAAFALELNDGVERTAGWFAANPPPKPVADPAERQRQREHLRDALDRERHIAVAAGRNIAVIVDDDEAEGLRVDPRQFGDIGRDLVRGRAVAASRRRCRRRRFEDRGQGGSCQVTIWILAPYQSHPVHNARGFPAFNLCAE